MKGSKREGRIGSGRKKADRESRRTEGSQEGRTACRRDLEALEDLPEIKDNMNIKTILRKAKKTGYKIDRNGDRFRIKNIKRSENPIIETDKKGLETFILYGIDSYLSYCEEKSIEPF